MEDEPEERTKCQYCITGFKQFITFLLSHVGLLTLVVGYCLIGAVTFKALEADHEKEVKRAMVRVREAVSEDLWQMTRKTDIIIPKNWTANASKRLQDFETELVKAIRTSGWDGNEDTEQLNWTFTGALFYSIVVITTIGYGHIAPKTVWGKIVTIFYAIVGIPLMVVCWSHIGDFMANSFRFIYWRVCCYLCTKKPKHRHRGPMRRGRSVRGPPGRGSSQRMKRSIRRSGRVSQRSADSAMSDSAISAMSDPGAYGLPGATQHFSTLPRTAQPKALPHPSQQIPHGHSHHSHKQRSAKSAEPELAPNLPVLYNKYADDLVRMPATPEADESLNGSKKGDGKPQPGTSAQPGGISRNRSMPPDPHRFMGKPEDFDYWEEEFDEYYEDSDYEEEDIGSRPVPIWLCSSLVIGYIVGGAYLFSNWEDWNFLDSAYFCFITLTTIGFGDFVPTQDSESSIALCSLYLLFGIALLAMSFNLVQEQVISSVKSLAMTLGILDDEEDR
ncbi:unnamed protein product [Orchesella dallaii]|uniref:Potassium channel domain-containing protein n=1 Tax=Orchesella dallaii TaxID=48710 RepID=A0ABP1S2V1_9HEXA